MPLYHSYTSHPSNWWCIHMHLTKTFTFSFQFHFRLLLHTELYSTNKHCSSFLKDLEEMILSSKYYPHPNSNATVLTFFQKEITSTTHFTRAPSNKIAEMRGYRSEKKGRSNQPTRKLHFWMHINRFSILTSSSSWSTTDAMHNNQHHFPTFSFIREKSIQDCKHVLLMHESIKVESVADIKNEYNKLKYLKKCTFPFEKKTLSLYSKNLCTCTRITMKMAVD